MNALDLKAHIDFFDRLVELIPAKHYLSEPDDRVDLRHMKKKDREAAKEQFKRQHKEEKKSALDPSNARGTLDLLKLKSNNAKTLQKGPFDREALKAKLQARLEDLRKQRKADESGEKVENAKQWRDAALAQGRLKAAEKRKLSRAEGDPTDKTKTKSASSPNNNKYSGSGVERPTKQQKNGHGSGGNGNKNVGAEDDYGNLNLKFSKIEFGGSSLNDSTHRRKGRAPSKAELLKEAERKQAEAANADPGKVSHEAWGAALKRAQGEKVFDDPKLIRKSLKKDAKLKKKKAQAWQERLEKQSEGRETKQAKRKNNLQRRIDAKKEAKKARREKKLLRAGFEGRKQTFIATPSPKTASATK